MNTQNQLQQSFVIEDLECFSSLCAEEQAILKGGGKHSAEEKAGLRAAAKAGVRLGARAVPVLGTAVIVADSVDYGIKAGKWYKQSSIHNSKGHWWSFL